MEKKSKKKTGFTKVPMALPKAGSISLFTNGTVAAAIKRFAEDATLFDAVKMHQVFEAMYIQGKRDGAREAFSEIDLGMAAAKKLVKHKNPGRPRSPKAAKPIAASKAPRRRKRKKSKRSSK